MRKLIYWLLLLMVVWPTVSTWADVEPKGAKKKPGAWRVAVLDFQNRSGQDSLNRSCKIMSRLLAADLNATNGIAVLERDRLNEILPEIKLGEDGFVDPSSAPKAGFSIDAEFIIEGQLSRADDTITFEFHVFSLEKNEKILKSKVSGQLNDLLGIESKILVQIIDTLKPDKVPEAHVKMPHNVKLAVMPLEDLSPEGRIGSICDMLHDSLEVEFSQIPRISLLTREHLDAILEEQKLTLNALTDPKNAVKVGKIAGVEYMAFGSVTLVGTQLRVDVRIVCVETGKSVFNVSASGEFQKLMDIQGRLDAAILSKLNILLLKGDQDKLRRTRNAANEAMYHLMQLAQMAKGNRSVIGDDEVKALQRAMYLDALKGGTELFLIDKLIDSEMFEEANKRIRSALKGDLPIDIQTDLWHKLAKLYDRKGEMAILWHIVKNYPNTPAATKAYWYLSYAYNSQDVDNLPMADYCMKQAKKDMETVAQLKSSAKNTNIRTPFSPWGKYDGERLFKIILSSLDKHNQLDAIEDVDELKKYVYEFCEKFNKQDMDGAFEALKRFGRFHTTDYLSSMWEMLSYKYVEKADFDKAVEVCKARLDIYQKYSTRFWNWGNLLRDLDKAKERSELMRTVSREHSRVPEYPPDKPKVQASFWPSSQYWHVKCVYDAIETFPNNPDKAFEEACKLVKERFSKYGDKYDKCEYFVNCVSSIMVRIYLCMGKEKESNLVLDKYVKGSSIRAKLYDMGIWSSPWFPQFYTSRMQYEKALLYYDAFHENIMKHEESHFFAKIGILMYKMGDYKTALKCLQEKYGQNFKMQVGHSSRLYQNAKNLVGREHPRPVKELLDDVLYLAAQCYDGMGEYEKAYMHYGWLLRKDPSTIYNKDNLESARERMQQIEGILKNSKNNKIAWKVGDYWEGVQGWYLTSPQGKKMPEGWIFSDVYFRVAGTQKLFGIMDCYVLDVYNEKCPEKLPEIRNPVLPPNDTWRRNCFATIYVSKVGNAPFYVNYGIKCNMPRLEYTYQKHLRPSFYYVLWPQYQLILESSFTVMPFADNPHLPPSANIIFTYPFNTHKPEWLGRLIKRDNENVVIQGEAIPCDKITTSSQKDFNLGGYLVLETHWGASYADKIRYWEDDILAKLPNTEYTGVQWWSDQYPWWVKVIEKNPRYIEGTSPANAKYSKLFVLTKVNGKEVRVDTGLPGKLSDINEFRKSFEQFNEKYPYDYYPSAETEVLLRLYERFEVQKKDPSDARTRYLDPLYYPLLRRTEMAIPYFEDNLQRSNFIWKDILRVPDNIKWLIDMDRYIEEIPLEDSDSRMRVIGCRFKTGLDFNKCRIEGVHTIEKYKPALFELLKKHLKRCKKKNFPEREYRFTADCLILLNYTDSIPVLIEVYNETKDIKYLNTAMNILEGKQTPATVVGKTSTQEEIGKYIKLLEEKYQQIQKNKE